ncbi:FeoA family protein [Chlorobaculum parvum NCIB 8327]|uniref:FeoA family protein n=1 Tax=Chlorobaculum parvum (strain DSM 263 / NCIMB 8327) TaxID=517417 RepID=B3QPH6_CHLP8|nr:FeoA family protein [Chlorobaculum parvum]ACF11829.1 FeoA family protein [Chlorobaculum parvum NCIB 8327]
MAPLGMLGKGEVGEIVNLRPGRSQAGLHGHRHHSYGRENGKRLAEMGFSVGQTIEIIENSPGMPLLVRVHDSKVAIGRGIAMRVMVRRIAS